MPPSYRTCSFFRDFWMRFWTWFRNFRIVSLLLMFRVDQIIRWSAANGTEYSSIFSLTSDISRPIYKWSTTFLVVNLPNVTNPRVFSMSSSLQTISQDFCSIHSLTALATSFQLFFCCAERKLLSFQRKLVMPFIKMTKSWTIYNSFLEIVLWSPVLILRSM